MIKDLIFVLSKFDIVHLIGLSRLRERYARSRLGQLWVVLSQLINILIFGSVWSLIWNVKIDDHLPYVGVGFIVYGLIATTLNESSGAIISDGRYYTNAKTPYMLSIVSHVYRSMIVFLYNIPSIVILVIWSDSAEFKFDFVWVLGWVALLFFLIPWCYVISVSSTRFRDLIQLWGLIFQTAFLVSPLMWRLDFVPPQYHTYFLLNPLAAFLEILRNPIIGINYSGVAILSIAVWTIVGIIIAFLIKLKFEKKLSVWL
jgi:lipopolysaccharide transport system permease protein